MTKVRLVYASMSGGNEKLAKHVEGQFLGHGATVVRSEISQTDAADFLRSDICVIVTYTYHDGALPDEAVDFFDDMEELDLQHKVFGVCGGSSSLHHFFGRAVDYFDEALIATGAIQGAQPVKIDQGPDAQDYQNLNQFVDEIMNTYQTQIINQAQ